MQLCLNAVLAFCSALIDHMMHHVHSIAYGTLRRIGATHVEM